MQTRLPFGQPAVDHPAEPTPKAAPPPEPPTEEATARLSAELERALVRELAGTYEQLNASFFKRRLRPVTLELFDSSSRLGLWTPRTRTIQMSRAFTLREPWGVVVEVLKHEMAHQFVHEVLQITDETAHGPAFREVCERLGVDGSASGTPKVHATEDRVLERIARLLALADSPNVNEAQAAMSAAQRLMLKYNLERAALPRAYGFRHIGEPARRVLEPARLLGAILGEHFFVEVIWVPVYLPAVGARATVLEACGAPENLEMAEYVHGFLRHTAEHLWRAHEKTLTRLQRRDRTTFLAGVMLGFYDKLNGERAAQKQEGLVWVKDGDLSSFYRRRHPHVQTVRHQGNQRNESHSKGREAGRKIVLSKPVGGGPSGGGPALLGPTLIDGARAMASWAP